MENNSIQVSIVIVCMNNLKNLYPCLNSIKKYTTVSYETLVVAYLFSKENLEKVKTDFPWVTFIESNEIRGFSENNNLALKQAKGKYCFVLNDDTYFYSDVVTGLKDTFLNLPENAAIVSPLTLNKDGSVQRNGKPCYNLFTLFLSYIRLIKYYDKFSKYTNKSGIYQTYNISGAAFMIKTAVFQNLGWFDERYFFCPEDIALSTHINILGMKCYVNTSMQIIHLGGGTRSKIISATKPAAVKGGKIFYCGNSFFRRVVFLGLVYFFHSLYGCFWLFKFKIKRCERCKIMYKAHFNTICTVGSQMTPKEIFIKYYCKQ